MYYKPNSCRNCSFSSFSRFCAPVVSVSPAPRPPFYPLVNFAPNPSGGSLPITMQSSPLGSPTIQTLFFFLVVCLVIDFRSTLDSLAPITKLGIYSIWYLVSYGISCHWGNFTEDTSYEQVSKHCHGWWMSLGFGQNTTFSCQQLVMKYCHGWLKFG